MSIARLFIRVPRMEILGRPHGPGPLVKDAPPRQRSGPQAIGVADCERRMYTRQQ